MKITAIIPARMGSSRFPGKPLATLLGIPMLEHVYKRTALSEVLDSVIVATCDQEIVEAVEQFGGTAVMTSPTHQRASDRIAEAAENLDSDIVVMVQGDEPMVIPEMIDASVSPMLTDVSIECVNLAKRIEDEEEYLDPNTIKVVMDKSWDAIYFSREPIPTKHIRDFANLVCFKQVCIIPFRKDFLLYYSKLPPTLLEESESVDMLRLLEHGHKVRMIETQAVSHAVDTPSDLARVELMMQKDPLVNRYLVN